MKLNGVISYSCVDDAKEEEETPVSETSPPPASIVVGYALTSKKKKSFLKPKLIRLARNKGIQFVPIDLRRPLSEQGSFNIILYKIEGKDWSQVIEDYPRLHPMVTIVDFSDAIQHLRNRQSMLEVVANLKLPDSYGNSYGNCQTLMVCTLRQLVISKDPNSVPDEVAKAGLIVPLGGVLFKVFIVGESIKIVRRFSLSDVTESDLSRTSGVFCFPRVSCAESSADDVDLDPTVTEHPPRPLLEMLTRELHHRLGLRLFNIDMICQKGAKDLCYVIDINYFPD